MWELTETSDAFRKKRKETKKNPLHLFVKKTSLQLEDERNPIRLALLHHLTKLLLTHTFSSRSRGDQPQTDEPLELCWSFFFSLCSHSHC